MDMLYSKTTGGFYEIGTNKDVLPADAILVPSDKYKEIFSDTTGKIISSDRDGNPTLVTPTISTSKLAEQVRAQRDQLLYETQWLVQRHRDQIEIGTETTLSANQFKDLQTYRQTLRDIPARPGFPTSINWPDVPECAKEIA